MTILFVGCEADAFETPSTHFVETNTAYYDSIYARHAMAWDSANPIYSAAWVPPGNNEVWLHFEHYWNTNNQQRSLDLIDAGGTAIARLTHGNAVVILSYWNGSTFVEVGRYAASTQREAIDIQVRNTASGRIAFYLNNYLVAEVLGDFSALANVVRVKINSAQFSPWYLSQVIVADEPTIGFHAAYRQPTANGTYNAWTGTFDEVNDPVPNNASFISSNTNDQRESFTKPIFNVPNGFQVKAVAATALAKRGASGPQNLALMIRFGSTDYDSPDKPLDLGFKAVQHFWHLNPATTLPWVNSDAGSVTVEVGVKARA